MRRIRICIALDWITNSAMDQQADQQLGPVTGL